MAKNATDAVLNTVGNQIMDILDTQGVSITANMLGTRLVKDGRGLYLHDIQRQALNDEPPRYYDAFLARQTAVNVQKEYDYDKAFTKGLIAHGRAVWAWEVHKKLQRVRTWLERGTLKVTGEGANNAVGDLFNYTVLYCLYTEATKTDSLDPDDWKHVALYRDNVTDFHRMAASRSPEQWVAFLIDEGLVGRDEFALQATLIRYMGG